MQQPSRLFIDGPGPEADEAKDSDLERVAATLLHLDPEGLRGGKVIRETFDQLLDGQRTGRWDYRQLRKTEKTHMGTLVEINLHREFGFDDGHEMDYRIAGVDVDCKFSQSSRGWQIPIEAQGHICFLICAGDDLSLWSGGLVRISEAVLRVGQNRDRKRTLNERGLQQVRWLWRDCQLPENLLLHLDEPTRRRIFSFSGKRNGQRRIDELFRVCQGRLINRTTVLTVGQQDDAPKRVRDARIRLRPEGITILGHQGDHRRIAQALGVPVPSKGEWVSIRLTLGDAGSGFPCVSIGSVSYRAAADGDPVILAPVIDARTEEI